MSFTLPSRVASLSLTSYSAARAPSGFGPSGSDVADADTAKRQFEALILQSAFAPVATALGFYGDLVIGPVLRSILHAESR